MALWQRTTQATGNKRKIITTTTNFSTMFDEYYVNEPICLFSLSLSLRSLAVSFEWTSIWVFSFLYFFFSFSSAIVVFYLVCTLNTIFLERDVNKRSFRRASKRSIVPFRWRTTQSHTNTHTLNSLKCSNAILPYLNYRVLEISESANENPTLRERQNIEDEFVLCLVYNCNKFQKFWLKPLAHQCLPLHFVIPFCLYK